jgi:hypothetical protein
MNGSTAGGERDQHVHLHRHEPAGLMWPGTTLSFHTAVGCHWLPFLRDLSSNFSVNAAIFCQKNGTAEGQRRPRLAWWW